MKVLIIDDEIDLSLLLRSYFQRKGFDVYLAHSLTEGLQKLQEVQPQYLFLDNNFPDGLGWVEAPVIARQYPGITQYLVSAYHPSLPDMPEHAAYRILEKPISFADLDKLFRTSAASENEASTMDA